MLDVIRPRIPIASVNGRRRSPRTRRRPTAEMSTLIGEFVMRARARAPTSTRIRVRTRSSQTPLEYSRRELSARRFFFIVSLSMRNIISGWKCYANRCRSRLSADVAPSGIRPWPRDDVAPLVAKPASPMFTKWRVNVRRAKACKTCVVMFLTVRESGGSHFF